MTEFMATLRTWWMPVAAGAMLVAILVLFALLIPALGRISNQAKAGQAVKTRQCSLLPASHKIYVYMERKHVLSREDLRRFLAATSPLDCPPR